MVISLNKNLYYGINGYYQSKYPGVLEEVYNKVFATIHLQRDGKRLGGGTLSTVNAWVQYITTELLDPGY